MADFDTLSRVSIVIPVRNDARRLERCLRAIRRGSHPKEWTEVVVADNGSSDDSGEVARRMGAKVLSLPRLTVAALRNRGVAEACGEIIAFIDADHEIGADWVTLAVDLFRDPEVGAVGAPYTSPPEPTWVQSTYDLLRDHRPGAREVAWLGSGNLAIRRALFESIGGFDERMTTCEDVDLCARLRARGGRIVSDSRLRSVHYGDPATLRAVFRSELWRGQDNLRVTLRSRPSLRDLPSVVLPIVSSTCVLLLLVGALLGEPWYFGLGAAGAAGVVVLRALRMALNGSGPGTPTLGRIAAVAAVYEAARAGALVLRVRHRRASRNS